MLRSALLLCAGLLAAVCFACAQYGTGSAIPIAGGGARVQDATCGDGKPFHTRVSFLTGFTPNPSNPTNSPGAGNIVPVKDNDQPYADDLDQVFLLAPAAFRNHLCGLNGIFLDTTNCQDPASCFGNSWGYRIRVPGNPAQRGRYIAIPKSLWSFGGGSRKYTYLAYENDLLAYTFGWKGDPVYTPTYTDADPNTFEMTILAALAHEMGHVRWYDIFDAGYQGKNDYTRLKPYCGGNDFFLGWLDGGAGLEDPPAWRPPKWRHFLTRSERHNPNHPGQQVSPLHFYKPQIDDIDAFLTANQIQQAASALDQLYSPAWPWASYYAAVSPDEDFVESYKFHALTQCKFNANGSMDCGNAVLKSLQMQMYAFSTYRQNIPLNYVQGLKPDLTKKIRCIDASMGL